MLRIASTFLLLSLSTVGGAEPFTAEHLVTLDRVGAPVVSPDGTTVVIQFVMPIWRPTRGTTTFG